MALPGAFCDGPIHQVPIMFQAEHIHQWHFLIHREPLCYDQVKDANEILNILTLQLF